MGSSIYLRCRNQNLPARVFMRIENTVETA
jgi:hypothetical protein